MSTMKSVKPLGQKNYGSIPHLPGSRMGPADHHCHEGQARICCDKVRDKHDWIIVQQKYDGSNVGVVKMPTGILPGEGPSLKCLSRAGYECCTSPYEQHHIFAGWAFSEKNAARFHELLQPGERIVGEWLAQAHGTRYEINILFEPFVALDIMRGTVRLPWDKFVERICEMTEPFTTPQIVGVGPMPIAEAMEKVCNPWALDPIEGVVYRVERKGAVDFLTKYVRPDKVDGSYLPEMSGKEPVWNWRPPQG